MSATLAPPDDTPYPVPEGIMPSPTAQSFRKDYKHHTRMWYSPDPAVGVDLFDDDRDGFVSVYVRYGDGSRAFARDIHMAEGGETAVNILRAWAKQEGVRDYRNDQSIPLA